MRTNLERRTKLLAGAAAIALMLGAGAIAQSVRAPSLTDDGKNPATNAATVAPDYKSPRTQAERIQDLKRQSAAKKDRAGRTAGSVEPLPSAEPKQAEAPAVQPPAAQQNEQPPANVRTVYPNQTGPQNAQGQAPSPRDQTQKNPPAESAHQAQPNATPPQGAGPAAQPSASQSAQQPAAPPPTPQQNEVAQTAPASAPSATQGTQGSTGIVALNTQQQTQVGQTIAQHKVQPLSNVSFSIAIGTAVPRSVQLRALPADLASFVPQYRGYSYFVVEDEVVIVDPASYQIVTIMPYTASAHVETAPQAAPPPAPKRTAAAPRRPLQSKSVKLDTQDRDAVRSYLRERRPNSAAVDLPRKRRGEDRIERVERSVTVERPREEVYEEAPRRGFFDFFGPRAGPRPFDPDDD
jgi:hypothetical protein